MNTLELFRSESEYKEYKAGDLIFEEGEAGENMYIVKEGAVDIKVGEEIFVVAGAGEILGEMALIDSSARSATAVAKTACKLIPVNEKRFAFLVQQTPFFAIHVMKVLVERLRKMNKIMAASG